MSCNTVLIASLQAKKDCYETNYSQLPVKFSDFELYDIQLLHNDLHLDH